MSRKLHPVDVPGNALSLLEQVLWTNAAITARLESDDETAPIDAPIRRVDKAALRGALAELPAVLIGEHSLEPNVAWSVARGELAGVVQLWERKQSSVTAADWGKAFGAAISDLWDVLETNTHSHPTRFQRHGFLRPAPTPGELETLKQKIASLERVSNGV